MCDLVAKRQAAFLRVYEAVMQHALDEHPREACGLLVRRGRAARYVPCRNIAPLQAAKDRFVLDPHDWAAAEDGGEILAVVHSHPDADAHPSGADRRACHRSRLPWFIVQVPGGAWRGCNPETLPLEGRVFDHGAVDCYTLIQDYYAQRLGIELPDFERDGEWWVPRPGQPAQDLYRQGFGRAGFVELGQVEPRLHDVLLMQIRSEVENHAAVMVGPDEHGPRILHHLADRLSGHDRWGGMWKRSTTTVLRHGSKL